MVIETKDFFTLAIAVWGAGLSTFNLVEGLRRERRRVRIIQTAAFYAYPGQGLGAPMMALEIVNHGHRPVVINAPQMRLPDGRHMALWNADSSHEFPKNLTDGESVTVRFYYAAVSDSLKDAGYRGTVRLRPTCTDTTGKRFFGKVWKFDLDTDWAAA